MPRLTDYALIKLLIIALLIYLAARAVRNLTRAVRLDEPGVPPRVGPRPPGGRPPGETFTSRASRPHSGRPGRIEEDVEDAKWEDL